ncbi:hypothetical protein ACIB24_10050 [Spongisporangium articulatum]|uniref:Integral membrane protein n=1 Tax=Spongisporangium articulatum TaxID=3362603 RepID=A0ABW8AM02_9ACTN
MSQLHLHEDRRARPRAGRAPSWLSLALVAPAAPAAALTLVRPSLLHGNPAMNGSARGTALVLLLLGLPCLVLVATRTPAVAWLRPVWLGVLGYVLYQCVLFLFATPFNELFLLYTSMTALTLAALVTLTASVDTKAVADRWRSPGAARGLAAFLGVLVVANTAIWLSDVVPGLAHADAPQFLVGTGLTTNPIYVQDFSFWLPLGVLTVVLLWRSRPWGVVLGGAYLAMWTLEGVSVAVDQWFGSRADPSSPVVASSMVAPFLVLAALTLVALITYLRVFTRARTDLIGGTP